MQKENIKNVSDWEEFYRRLFGISVDLSSVKIPPRIAGYDRLIVVIPEMTMRTLFDKCNEMFGIWKYFKGEIDDNFVQSQRSAAKGAYAIWTKDAIGPDEELKNISKKEFGAKAFCGMTLPERLLMELKFNNETGDHLDAGSATVCSGSFFLMEDPNGFLGRRKNGHRLDRTCFIRNDGFPKGNCLSAGRIKKSKAMR